MISDRWMILSFQSLVLMFHNNGKDVSEIPMVSSWFPRSYRNLCASAPLRPPSFLCTCTLPSDLSDASSGRSTLLLPKTNQIW